MFGTITVLILSLELAACQGLTPARENDVEAVRLVGGYNTREGRVEVMVDGVWGTVCKDYTNNAIARVICRSIGSPFARDYWRSVSQWHNIIGRSIGRLEVQIYNSSWGTVCDDHFDNVDARVVCRSLGLPTTNAVAIRRHQRIFGSGQGPIHLDEVACNGDETSLADCQVEYVHDCDHEEDVEMRCAIRTYG